jgi:hypothetical protein
MKIDVTQKILNFAGEPIKDANGVSLMMRHSCIKVLTTMSEYDTDAVGEKIDGDEKFRRGMMAETIRNQKNPDLTVDDWGLIRELVGKYYEPLTVMRVWNMIDNPQEEKKTKPKKRSGKNAK